MIELSTTQAFLDSREVAEMTGKRHSDLLRDIDNYVSVIDGHSDSEYNADLRCTQNANLRSDQFFIEKSYTASNGKRNKNYHLTKQGCEMIANKMTGKKGILFTAEYVTRFNKMEQKELQQPTTDKLTFQKQRAEAMVLNAKTRQAKHLEGIVSKYASRLGDESVQSLLSHSTFLLTGQNLIPKSHIEEKHYTATEIGEEIGVNKQKVGRTANKHELKKKEYGMWVLDKSRYSNKQVNNFLYNEKGKEKLRELLG